MTAWISNKRRLRAGESIEAHQQSRRRHVCVGDRLRCWRRIQMDQGLPCAGGKGVAILNRVSDVFQSEELALYGVASRDRDGVDLERLPHHPRARPCGGGQEAKQRIILIEA